MPSPGHAGETQCLHEAHKVIEAHVGDDSAPDSIKEKVRLTPRTVRSRYDKIRIMVERAELAQVSGQLRQELSATIREGRTGGSAV